MVSRRESAHFGTTVYKWSIFVTQTLRTSAFPIIDISGNASERGIQYGSKAQQYILQGIANYKSSFAEEGISWAQACQTAASFIPRLKKEESALFTEIEGIAQGAGVNTEEILAINCRTEILYGQNKEVNSPTDGCTGAIALPSASASGKVLHGQNWDWQDECAETSIVLRITPDKGPKLLIHTEAGILARCGINSEGIALTGNFLKCDRDNQPGGIPIPFVRRKILSQNNYSAAIRIALSSPKSFSTNLMLSHCSGEAVNLETTPGETFWLQPENGLLVHANHFESYGALAKVKDEGLKVASCSLHRARRVREALSANIGDLNIEHFISAFSDKFDNPNGVCAEPDQGPGGDTSSTVATILLDASLGKMWIAPRPYDTHTYTEYSLTD